MSFLKSARTDENNAPDFNPCDSARLPVETLFLALFIFFLTTQSANLSSNPDDAGYYAHLRSAVIDRDVFYLNEFDTMKTSPYFYYPTATGFIQNHWPVGCAILWAPFYLVERAALLTAHAAGADVRADGYSGCDFAAVTFASRFLGFLALLLCLRIASVKGGEWSGAAAVVAAWLGTTFFSYQFYFPMMSHACSAFTVSLFVYAWLSWRGRPTPVNRAALGALAALAAMTRTELAVVALLPIVDEIVRTLRNGAGKTLSGLALFAASAFVFFTPQMLVWWTLNGSPFASRQGEASALLLNPHVADTLFSSWHGLFAWTPATALALLGWLALMRRDFARGLAVAATFAALLYLNSSVIWWWGGAAFGSRYFTGLFPLFVIGLAEFLRAAPRPAGFVAAALCVAWTLMLQAQFLAGMIPLERFQTLGELIRNSGVILTHGFPGPNPAAIAFSRGMTPAAAAAVAALSFVAYIAYRKFACMITAKRLLACLAVYILFVSSWTLFCRANSVAAIESSAAGIKRASRYNLDLLTEPFPFDYASYYYATRGLVAADSELSKLERALPDNPAVHVARAALYMNTGDRNRARQSALRAARMEIRHPITKRTLEHILNDLQSGKPARK